jgi:hypothetical protein
VFPQNVIQSLSSVGRPFTFAFAQDKPWENCSFLLASLPMHFGTHFAIGITTTRMIAATPKWPSASSLSKGPLILDFRPNLKSKGLLGECPKSAKQATTVAWHSPS